MKQVELLLPLFVPLPHVWPHTRIEGYTPLERINLPQISTLLHGPEFSKDLVLEGIGKSSEQDAD